MQIRGNQIDEFDFDLINHLVHSCWVVNPDSMKIIHANEASEKIGHPAATAVGKSLESLLEFNAVPVGQALLVFLRANAGKDVIGNIREIAVQPPTDLYSAQGPGEPLTIRVVPRPGNILLILRPALSPLVREYISNTQDFLLVIDEKERIRRVTPNWFLLPFLRRMEVIGRAVTTLLPDEAWTQYKRAADSAMDYVRRYDAAPHGPDETRLSEAFRDSRPFIMDDQTALWKFEPDGGVRFSGSEEGYLYFKDAHLPESGDFTLQLRVRVMGNGRVALVFNQERPDKWDTLGYNAGLQSNDDGIKVTLKKNTRHVVYQLCKKIPPGEILFRVEKTGGVLRLFLADLQVAEYADVSPVSNQHGCFGILAAGNMVLKEMELRVRASGFDTGKTLPPAFRVRVDALPNRWFDLSPITFDDWAGREMPVICEALLLRDVTELACVEATRDELDRKYHFVKRKEYFGFVGGNEKILELVEQVDRFADSNATVLVQGPTGSGKEILARAIHLRSERRDKPFVKVDCAALPQTLLESELFGHEKGAFTGAVSRVAGRFEAAEKGTLFLDEIGNIDIATQAKLLGFLEDRTFTPLGGRQPVKSDVRIIAATNMPLEEMVGKGRFREDLFYRLKVFHIHLPPLRDRLDDLPLLTDSFIKNINARNNTKIEGLSSPVLDKLLMHSWPGNVRELYNLLLNLCVQQKKGVIEKIPAFISARTNDTIILPPERLRLDKLLEFAKERGYFAIRECRAVVPASPATLGRDLAKLVKKGKLRMEGQGPGARYFSIKG